MDKKTQFKFRTIKNEILQRQIGKILARAWLTAIK